MRRRRFCHVTQILDYVFLRTRHLVSFIALHFTWTIINLHLSNAEPQLSQFRCTGEDLILFCNPGSQIKIYNAIYGRSPARLCLSLPDDPCIRPELEEISQLCNEKTECTIAVTTKSLPQCWPLQSDNLQVEFECVTDAESALSSPRTTPSFIPPLVITEKEREETTPNSILLQVPEEREAEAEILNEIEPNHFLDEDTYLNAGIPAESEGYGAPASDMGPIIGGSVAAVIIMILASVLIALVVCRGHSKRFNKFQFSNESSDVEFGTIKQRESRRKGLARINYASLDLPVTKSDGDIASISHPRPQKNQQQQKPPKNATKLGQNHNRDDKPRNARGGDLPPAQSRAARAAAARPKTSSSETSSNGGKSKLEYGSWRVYQKPRDARAIKGSDVYY